MPLFITEAELERDGGDVNAVIRHADVFIRDIQQQLETHKARADAASINAEQTCSLIEQKFLTLSAQFSQLENEKEQSFATLERRSTELAQAQAQIHKLEIEAIKHNSATERLSFEVGELTKAKRELLEVVEQRNLELDEKNKSIKTYLNKVVELTDERSILEGKLHEHEAEVIRSRASLTRISQEKELVEQHNAWLNEELTVKASALLEDRHESAEAEADLRSKLAEAERTAKEAVEALQRSKEHTLDLESKLGQTREELKYLKEDSAVKEEQFSAEVATAAKLVELYKQSSDDWSKKSHELEGVIKALETHLNQVEEDYKEKLAKEVKAREVATIEAAEAKEKLEKALVEVNSEMVKAREGGDFLALSDKPYRGSIEGQLALEFPGDGALIPVVATEVSGTALAAALLRDGWSLAKMYSKYQEAVDAWRHERQERRHSQALLERVLHEIELRASVIMDERVAHIEMVEAYHKMEEKLQHFMEDQNALESSCKELKAEVRMKEREFKVQQKEITDLQTQVAVLLKECSDVQQRFGVGDQNGGPIVEYMTSMTENTAVDTVISERLLTFKDIRGMVEHNTQLRTLVRTLGQQNDLKEKGLKEEFEAELKRRLEEIGRNVAETVKRSEEQSEIIDRLQGTVGMYRRLYEDEMNARRVSQLNAGVPVSAPKNNSQDLRKLLDGSQEEIGKMREESTSRIKQLEEELTKSRHDITNMRVEVARVDGEASFAREQLSSLMRDTENQRKEMETVLSRNMEFSQTITDYQRRLRENAQKLQAAEDIARRRSIESSVTEREKELLAAAEKKASEEVATLSERVHRLQAALDTIHTVEEARESVRAAEKKKLEDELNNLQKEWAEAKKELEMERAHGRYLTSQRDRAVSEALERVEAVSKELADALKAVSAAETRAQVAEVRCTELQLSLKKSDEKVLLALGGAKTMVEEDDVALDVDSKIMLSLQQTKEELERANEDLAAAKAHTDQYKKIANVSEEVLKQMEEAYSNFKEESERRKEALETELRDSHKRLSDLEVEISEKDKVAGAAAEAKERSLSSALKDISSLKDNLATEQAAKVQAEERITTLKQEVDKLHQQWREAQNNYERQVLLQADTIRDLTTTSDKLSNLELSERTLCERAENAEAELESLHVSWAMEKSTLEAAKLEAEKKVKDLDEQNQILLDRLEGMHIVAAETERKSSISVVESGQSSEVQGESDLQNVIRYLRRSKETADTELTLMKQERVRLQKQLEGAYRAAEEAQTSLRREHESARASLYTDEEFRTLQAQVRELNLLRESNAELREENKKSFEDCREWREKAREAQAELEPLRKHLREKEVDLESSGRMLESQKAQTQRWEKRVTQLLEKYKAVDLDEYQRVKTELAAVQEREKESGTMLEAARKEIQELKLLVTKLEEEKQIKDCSLNKLDGSIADLDRRLQEALQSEGNVKNELTRFKKHAAFQKKKIDDLNKEKDETIKEIDNLKKQIEELRSNSGRRPAGDQLAARNEAVKQLEARLDQNQKDSTKLVEQTQKEASNRIEQIQKEAMARYEQVQKESDNQMKERESRIQVLEKALEREKEESRKERARRTKNEKTFYEAVQRVSLEKKKLLEELNSVKLEKDHYHGQMISAGLRVEPLMKAPELEERVESDQTAVQQLKSGVALETSNSSAPTSSATTIAPDVSVSSETIHMSTDNVVPAEFMNTTTTPASVVPALLSTPVSLVQAVPVPTPGPLSSNSAGIPSVVPLLRPPLRSSSTNATPASLRPPARVTPPVVGPTIATPTDIARDRQIMQLRAKIQEQEKAQAQAQAQARKAPRRLVRPRIEPAGTASNVSTEAGETSVEAAAEGTDIDSDILDEGKSVVNLEVPENIPSSSTSMSAAANAVPSASLVESVIVTAPPTMAVSVARKRAAPALDSFLPDDDLSFPDSKTEDAPPQKKSRPAEDTSMEDADALADLPTPTVDAEPAGGMAEEENKPVDVSSVAEVNPVVDATTISDLPDTDRDRPVADTSDVPVQKKPRFVQSELVSISSQPLDKSPSSESKDIVEQKDMFDVTELVQEGETIAEVGGSVGELPGNESLAVLEMPIFVEEGQIVEAPSLMDDIGAAIFEPIASEPELSMDLMAGSAVDEAIVEFQRASSEIHLTGPIVTESTTVTTITDEHTITVTEIVVVESESRVEEAEEGEIVSEVMEMETASTEAGLAGGSGSNEGKVGNLEETMTKEIQETIIPPPTPAVADQAQESAEGSGGAYPVINPELSVPSTLVSETIRPEDGQSAEMRPAEEKATETGDSASGHRTRLATGTAIKPSGRGTTINLADRAKERAALRRGGASPPSPGVRGRGRGSRGKRGGAAGRGRLISTGVGGRGEGSATPPQPGAPQPNSGEGSQQQPTSTSNPFEALKDDQS